MSCYATVPGFIRRDLFHRTTYNNKIFMFHRKRLLTANRFVTQKRHLNVFSHSSKANHCRPLDKYSPQHLEMFAQPRQPWPTCIEFQDVRFQVIAFTNQVQLFRDIFMAWCCLNWGLKEYQSIHPFIGIISGLFSWNSLCTFDLLIKVMKRALYTKYPERAYYS